MSAALYNLLPSTPHGIATSFYDGSSNEFESPPVLGSSYYAGATTGSQTLLLSVTNFQGLVELQGSLDSNAETATWATVYEYGDFSSHVTENFAVNIRGNYAWLRAKVSSFEHGVINEMRISF